MPEYACGVVFLLFFNKDFLTICYISVATRNWLGHCTLSAIKKKISRLSALF
jgi:hypothetical protein